ncbi:hypothetical protein Lal_00019590 [Lupinus albus]|nr:hypothetical protein Lal_00019590 [Lupinus albus]
MYGVDTDNNDAHYEVDKVTHTTRSKSGFWSERENVIEKPMWNGKNQKIIGNKRGRKTLEIAGSRLPDCLHACGSCTPCRLIIVSLACAFHTEEAESCPISYRCMCNSKSYPVP